MRDLEGATVILTRAIQDNVALRVSLEARGAAVVELPCVAIRPLLNVAALGQALRALAASDRLVLTSRAGATAVGRALRGRRLRARVAVVGAATLEAARRAGLEPDFVPSRPDGATLGRELPIPRGTVLLARADRALPELPAALRARGAEVREVVAYHTVTPAPADVARAREALATLRPIVFVASPSGVDGLVELVGADLARRARPVALGERTAARVRERLALDPAVAGSPEREAIVRAISHVALEVQDDDHR
ncbi:MAG: uroporphyrinogen-III synthase [Candidatus Limnocylindria bacterium]|nr:uroporphyrinogen-III synthase [Candidatus Limnocylindria bacterium]